jgi:hypothetical protein
MPTLTAQLWNTANTSKVADLTESFDRRFRDPVSDVGTGELSVLATDTNAADLTVGKVVRFLIDGTAAFSWRIDRRELRAVDSAEESGQVVKVSGRGLVVDFADAVVYPQGGVDFRPQSDTRSFAWHSSLVSTSGWASAVNQFPNSLIPNVYDTTNGWPPAGWPAPVQSSSVRWIWSRAKAAHPAGTSLFRKSFTLASTKQLAVFLAGTARCYLDGIELIPWTATFPSWGHNYTTNRVLVVSAGTHELAIEARLDDFSSIYTSPSNLGCVLCAVHEVPTSGGFTSSTLVVGTDATWKCQDYPAAPWPAPTPGQILNTLVTEAQARGALSGWSFGGSFSATTDSAGNAWASSEEFAVKVGDSLLSVLRALVDSELVDFRTNATGKTLSVYNYGAATGSSGVTLAAGTNLLELTHTSEAV